MAKGNLEDAKNYFLNALECDPSNVEGLYNLGKYNRYTELEEHNQITLYFEFSALTVFLNLTLYTVTKFTYNP